MSTILIYGSYGYTGKLITAQALQQGMRPILAGRDADKVRAQAKAYKLEYRAFSLDDSQALDSALREAALVIHCAGPFVHTFRQMSEACLRTGTHYLDISGEIPGFEALAALDQEAKTAGVMLLPGAGFDVVPSDCLSAHIKHQLPSATQLRLFIRGVRGGFSRGTATSAIENLQRQGMIRREGQLEQVPPAWKMLEVDFGRGPVKLVSVGWGDVSTAYYSTGIPNIETYMAFPASAIQMMRLMRRIGPLLYNRPAKALLKSLLKLQPEGPSDEQRRHSFSLIIAEARDDSGRRVRAHLRTPDGYSLTALTTVAIAQRILSKDFKPGFQTPSLAYGADFILEFEGVERTDL
jgi:short subunit dehydrogenase-like uncharacterized protein